MKTQRRLIKNWEPRTSAAPRHLRFADTGCRVWHPHQDAWLRTHYGDMEDECLALSLNCDVLDVKNRAKRLCLFKSNEMCRWLRGERDNDPTAPKGYHWETEAEARERYLVETEQARLFTRRLARSFDFCTSREQAVLEVLLFEVWQEME